MQLNTEHIIYSFSVSATIAWLSIYRRAAGPAPSSKKLSRITSRHTTVVKWGRRILRRCCGTCPSSGWLFLKHAVRFFSATQWRIFIEIGRHAVRSGLSLWMRKTCFPATMTASMTTGCSPANNRFLFSFLHGSLSLNYKNNQIKKRDFLSYISMYGSQIMRASSPICSPSMQICFLPKQENPSIKNGRLLPQ